MRVWTQVLSPRRGWFAAIAMTMTTLAIPATAQAQYGAPSLGEGAVGENYHIEFSGSLWNPTLFGQISSEQFGQVGTTIDFLTDLDYVKARFRDMRIVLRPTRKAKFRIQYTPISYMAETRFTRDIVFNNIRFPVSVPIESQFDWKVWRLGYEYDFVYTNRGFVGMLLEARMTQFNARLKTNSPIFSPPLDEFNRITVPFPAIGVVARAYPVPQVAINFELSGFKLPESIDPNYKAKYFEWDLFGTVNLSNYVGVQAGWRKSSSAFTVKKDFGDLRFSGLWFGAAVRY